MSINKPYNELSEKEIREELSTLYVSGCEDGIEYASLMEELNKRASIYEELERIK
jgi:hypothetical protein